VIQFWWRSGSRFGSGSPKSEIRILRIGGGLCCLSISSFYFSGPTFPLVISETTISIFTRFSGMVVTCYLLVTQGWNCRGVGSWIPPVHVYRHSFLNENRFKISIPMQNFKHFDIWPLPSSFRSIPTLLLLEWWWIEKLKWAVNTTHIVAIIQDPMQLVQSVLECINCVDMDHMLCVARHSVEPHLDVRRMTGKLSFDGHWDVYSFIECPLT